MAEHALEGVVRRVRARLAPEPYREATDRELLERFLHRHDEGAFATLVRRHQRLVYAALNRVLSDPDDLEDAFQATFLVLVRKAAIGRWQEGLGPWLYGVAHRVAVNTRRETIARLRHEGQVAGQAGTKPDLSCRDACDLVHEELERLPQTLRLPLLLCYLEGKSRDEAAIQLGVSANVVKGRLERGRNVLRQRLLRRGVPLTAGLLVLLTHSTARASSPDLVEATVAALSGPSARVAALVRGVSATMISGKHKLVLMLMFLGGLLAALLGSQLGAARPPQAKEDQRPSAAKAPDTDTVEVSGRVIDEADAGISGAKLSLWFGKDKPRDAGEAGKDGRFRVKVSKADLDKRPKLIAQVKGRGADWIELRERPAGVVTLRLRSLVPIQGRIIDLEGQPVAGAVVIVKLLTKGVKDDLTTYFDTFNRGFPGLGGGGGGAIRPPAMPGMAMPGMGSSGPPLLSLPPAVLDLPASLKTDKAGRFRLDGVGRERLVRMDVQAPGMVLQSAAVVTRPGFKKTTLFVGPSFDLPLAPGKEVVGVVKEKGTGKPIAGAQVSLGGERISATNPARTDEQGRFRIEGVRKRPLYAIHVTSRDHYHAMSRLKDTSGRDPIKVELEMERGLYVEGRLLDGGTGKPIAGTIRYNIRVDNPALKTLALSPTDGRGTATVGADGKFRLLVVPGPGYLTVLADEDRFARMVPERWDGAELPVVSGQLNPNYYHAMVAINPDAKKKASLNYDICLAPGVSKSGSLVDPDDKPVTGIIVFGLKAVPSFSRLRHMRPVSDPKLQLKESTFTALGLDPKQPRHLVFIHPQKKLGKVLLVKGDEKGPLVVKLEPLGAISGRVLNDEGKAAPGRLIYPQPFGQVSYYKDFPIDLLHHRGRRDGRADPQQIAWLPQAVKTDDDGRFRIDGLIPGLKYSLLVRSDNLGPRARPSYYVNSVMVESGKTKEMGDLSRPPKVKPPQ
jgi:RNA polymerase sigma factor (sigma-70 family)